MLIRILRAVYSRIRELPFTGWARLLLPLCLAMLVPKFLGSLAAHDLPLLEEGAEREAVILRLPAFLGLEILVVVALYSSVVIAIHRLYLLGGSSIPFYGFTGDLNLLLRVSGYVLLLMIALGILGLLIPSELFSAVIGFEGTLLSYLACLVLLVMLSRFCLVFPATALGKKGALRYSWRQTSTNKVVAFSLSILLPLILMILTDPLIGSGEDWRDFVANILGAMCVLVVTIFLSEFYRQVTRLDPSVE